MTALGLLGNVKDKGLALFTTIDNKSMTVLGMLKLARN